MLCVTFAAALAEPRQRASAEAVGRKNHGRIWNGHALGTGGGRMYERAVVRHSRFYRANRPCGIRRRCAVPDDSGDGRAAAARRRGGRWREDVKRALGLLLGIAAVDLLFPHLPRIAMLLAAFYLICAAFMLHV